MYAKKASELVKELASTQPGQLCTFNNDLFAQVLEECNGHLHQLQPLMSTLSQSPFLPIRRCKTIAEDSGAEKDYGTTSMSITLRLSSSRRTSAKASSADGKRSRANSLPRTSSRSLLRPTRKSKTIKIQEHENKLKDISREDEMENSEDDRGNSQAEKTVIQGAMKSDQFGALVHHLSMVRNKRCLMAYVYNRAEVITNLGWMVDGDLPEEIEKRLSNSEKEYFKKHVDSLQSYITAIDLNLCLDMIPPKDPYIKVRVLDDIGKVLLGDQVAILARHSIMFLRRTDAEQYITQGQMEELTS